MNMNHFQPWYILLVPAFFMALALWKIYQPHWTKARNYRKYQRDMRVVRRAHKLICDGELPDYMKKPSSGPRTYLPHLSVDARAALHQAMEATPMTEGMIIEAMTKAYKTDRFNYTGWVADMRAAEDQVDMTQQSGYTPNQTKEV